MRRAWLPARPGLPRGTGGGRRGHGERSTVGGRSSTSPAGAATRDLLSFGMLCVGQVVARARRRRRRPAAARRGDGVGVDRRGHSDPRRHHLLRRDRGVRDVFDMRRAAEWTERAARVVHVGARSRALPRAVPGAPLAGAPGPRRLDPSAIGGGAARQPSGWPSRRTPRSASLATSRASCTASAGSSPRRRRHTARPPTLGRDPESGVALLRLAEGDLDDAAIAIRRMLAESAGPRRPTGGARGGGRDPPRRRGRRRGPPRPATSWRRSPTRPTCRLLRRHGRWRARCASSWPSGDADGAARRPALRRAIAGWQALGMPYEVARAASASPTRRRALGDDDAAELELDAARGDVRAAGCGARPRAPRRARRRSHRTDRAT